MALRWIEGFENRQHATYVARLYGSVAGAFTSFPAGRRMGSACRASVYTLTTPALVGSVGNTWTVGFGLKVEQINGANVPAALLMSGATEQLRVEFENGTTSGSMVAVVKRGSTVLATSAEIVMGSWHYFEFQAVVRTGVNGSYTVKMDGSNLVTAAGVNAADSGVDGADRVQLRWGGTSTLASYDDVYVRDDSTFLGAQVVLGTLPNGDGATLNFLPSTGSTHYQLVDDSVVSPSDGDDNSSNVDGDVDLYAFQDLSLLASGTTIAGLAVTCDLRMRSSGSRTVNVRFRNAGGSTGDLASFSVASRSFAEVMTVAATNPISAAAWTKSDVDGGQLGLRNVSAP